MTMKATNETIARKELVVVKDLVKYFPVRAGLLQGVVAQDQAVDGVTFSIYEGETLGWWASRGAVKPLLDAPCCA
jgi:ABC-type oligopeptide transport system, ATPase component